MSLLPALPAPVDSLVESPLFTVLLGLSLLAFGRRLFWFFVAGAGFVAGAHLAVNLLGTKYPEWVLGAGLLAGLIGAFLAVFVQKVAVAAVGSLTGGFLMYQALLAAPALSPEWTWLVVAIAAVAGAVLMVMLFRWALIVVTSLAGAHLLLQTAPLASPWKAMAYAALFVSGIVWQSRRPRPASE
jgi:hypothetical protein